MKQSNSILKLSMIIAILTTAVAPVISSAQTADDLFTAGVVLAVDTNQRLLTVEEASQEGRQLTFALGDNAQVSKDGQSIGLADIQVGDPVSIRYQEAARGNDQARSLRVITRPGPAASSR